MELYEQILVKTIEEIFLNWLEDHDELDIGQLINSRCYQALVEIRAILDNNYLTDFECIEEIIHVYERMGSDGGVCHDFG